MCEYCTEAQLLAALGGRALRAYPRGDTIDELEVKALDEARKLFGSEVQLQIVRNYEIVPALLEESSRYYTATGIIVREVVSTE